jgi:hypothetical protein
MSTARSAIDPILILCCIRRSTARVVTAARTETGTHGAECRNVSAASSGRHAARVHDGRLGWAHQSRVHLIAIVVIGVRIRIPQPDPSSVLTVTMLSDGFLARVFVEDGRLAGIRSGLGPGQSYRRYDRESYLRRFLHFSPHSQRPILSSSSPAPRLQHGHRFENLIFSACALTISVAPMPVATASAPTLNTKCLLSNRQAIPHAKSTRQESLPCLFR